ncbi:flagellar type III secretion system pore protein FliP [Colidextribacter sp. 210702-DFI.3.9]|uniref:Flagellar biosynthetic protein FliP n=1 Tax=Flintibacter faecis TaxID=2763047 RepID=A0A8J6IZY8_9FIRM|nr:flagellar type III secretion system pore protein FliP [Flintibacter faecis]MCB6500632.1 flagellar type III secretion system pore protein FliP [Colidextribacter sp. 210702-DFI.3.9]
MTESLINVNGENVQALEILFLTTMITLLPSLLVMMTSFTRYIISFSFLRSAIGTQQTPPNMVLVGMALFLTLFTMAPVVTQIQTEAYEPYKQEEISQEEFLDRAQVPLKEFMLRNTKTSTLNMFCDLAKVELPENVNMKEAVKLPLRVVVPSFMTCELQRAFEIGLLLYIPFMLIDIVVSSTLMSMGMIMLPPSMISMPFKLLLFVTVNGWELLFSSLVQSFK